MRRRIFPSNDLSLMSNLNTLPKTSFFGDHSDRDLYELLKSHYLQSSGWIESVKTRRPMRNGSPIPWFTYPAIDFLDSIELESKNVLEVGGGFSTLYWALRGCSGISLELDQDWSIEITNTLSRLAYSNRITVVNILNPLNKPRLRAQDFLDSRLIDQLSSISSDEYPEESLNFIENDTVLIEHLLRYLPNCDLFIVDGIARNLCLMMADKLCRDSALIILDNSDRINYSIGKNYLVSNGFEPTIFTGLGPINPYQWSTTLYRKQEFRS